MIRNNNFQQLLKNNARALLAQASTHFGNTRDVCSCFGAHWCVPVNSHSPQSIGTAVYPDVVVGSLGTRFFTASAAAWSRLDIDAPSTCHLASQSASPHRDGAPPSVVLYKGRGMRVFRVLVRMKIFQLTGVAALAIPITTFLSQGEVSPIQAVIASALLIGSGVASTALWYYSRRYVGELALLRDPQGQPTAARFSVLDFWGHRENNDVPLEDVVPPLQGVLPQVRAVMLREALIPIDVEGDRQYFLSLRYGLLLNKPLLLALLEGRLGEAGQQHPQAEDTFEQRAQPGGTKLEDS